ncbi:hypothetical protein [Skermania piniformis]|uniref:Type 2A encapsulin shell protein SrpI-like domain-containing protein n=1 Tax=Skermania pinensis TaxID=39122 RepID=A0ABX8SFI3_9ACTN|nr:hypothetical protein [Skermania piniformis]QXQ15180.1 hypothetical protein KV203_07530 [Skermania piniformis]
MSGPQEYPTSLGTAGARTLATVTKTVPQMRAITPRWLIRMLPWVDLAAGTYRVNRRAVDPGRPGNKHGEVAIEIASGHLGEATLPTTFADYDPGPPEYELAVAQTRVRVHTRVADLFDEPMDQTEQQLRLARAALAERQEYELLHDPGFGLLHHVHDTQRVAGSGPPDPDQLDELLSRRRKSRFFLAHPRTIAAFHRECTRRGLYPGTTTVAGSTLTTWRGVPLLPTDKLPIGAEQTGSVLVLRTGAADHGVVGLRPAVLPDQVAPGWSVRSAGIDERAVRTWLVSVYFAAARLVPDALGMLTGVDVGVRHERG